MWSLLPTYRPEYGLFLTDYWYDQFRKAENLTCDFVETVIGVRSRERTPGVFEPGA